MSLLNVIADDWIKPKSEKERNVMIKHAHNSRVITIFGYTSVIFGVSLLVLLPYFGKSLSFTTNTTDSRRSLPLQFHYLYNKDQNHHFEIKFISQSFVILIFAICYVGVDTFLCLLVFHLCGQLENLTGKLTNMNQCDNFSNSLTFIVEDHIRLIRYFETIESIFSGLLLGLLLSFAILFCLYGFLIVSVFTKEREIKIPQLLFHMTAITGSSMLMCINCVVGEILVTQCEGIYHAAFNYKWYKLEPERAKTLILIMIRTNKPLYITAGKMFPMTMSMFCNLIKTSAGYVSVLLARNS